MEADSTRGSGRVTVLLGDWIVRQMQAGQYAELDLDIYRSQSLRKPKARRLFQYLECEEGERDGTFIRVPINEYLAETMGTSDYRNNPSRFRRDLLDYGRAICHATSGLYNPLRSRPASGATPGCSRSAGARTGGSAGRRTVGSSTRSTARSCCTWPRAGRPTSAGRAAPSADRSIPGDVGWRNTQYDRPLAAHTSVGAKAAARHGCRQKYSGRSRCPRIPPGRRSRLTHGTLGCRLRAVVPSQPTVIPGRHEWPEPSSTCRGSV